MLPPSMFSFSTVQVQYKHLDTVHLWTSCPDKGSSLDMCVGCKHSRFFSLSKNLSFYTVFARPRTQAVFTASWVIVSVDCMEWEVREYTYIYIFIYI